MKTLAFESYAIEIDRYTNAPVSVGERLYYGRNHVHNSSFKRIGTLENDMKAILKLYARGKVDMFCLDLHDGYAYKILVLITLIQIE